MNEFGRSSMRNSRGDSVALKSQRPRKLSTIIAQHLYHLAFNA